MGNKIKEELRQRLQGQLSYEKTELDVNIAYSVVKKSVLSFSRFFADHCFELFDSKTYYIRDHETLNDNYTIEDLFELWENNLIQYEK